jgi:XTP/dITP diphosphohydrolase
MRIASGETLLVATGNRGNLAEISALLRPFGVSVVSLTDLGLDEPDETEFTFADNALLKARAGAATSGSRPQRLHAAYTYGVIGMDAYRFD